MSLKEILKDAQGVPTGEYKKIAGGTMYADSPIGSILPYGGTTAPSGWMICNGASLLRTDYAELFAIIGTAFGSADSTHFNIPDLRGEFLRGAGTNSHSGQGNGGSVGTHQDATGIDSFITEQTTHRLVAGYGAQNRNSTINADASTRSGLTGCAYHKVEQSITDVYVDRCFVRPTNTSVNYIIKAKMVALPADLDSAVDAKIAAKGVYSTSEVDTGKTWIDGKPIYRKVLEATLPSTSGDFGITHNINNLGQVINQYGMTAPESRGQMRQLDFAWYNNSQWDCCMYTNATKTIVQFGSEFATYHGGNKVYIVLEYTKTTD